MEGGKGRGGRKREGKKRKGREKKKKKRKGREKKEGGDGEVVEAV